VRKYYLFKLNDLNIKINFKKIYLVLEELFYLNSNKFKYGTTIFNELCLPIKKEILIKNLPYNYHFNNELIIDNLENTIIEIRNICIVIETNRNFPEILKYIDKFESNLIVCDFINKDYFLLDEFIKLNFKLAI